jgi:hypothetical protein
MYRTVAFLLLLLPSLAFAQNRSGQWTELTETGCVGGSRCPNKRLSVALRDQPVIAVRFRAHDQIGDTAGGVLRVKIDGNTVRGYIDIPRAGETFNIDVDELTGRQLIFEAAANDEVEISNIAVLYSRDNIRRTPPREGGILGGRDDRNDRGDRGGQGGWRQYRNAEGCIGGNDCRKNGTRITVALEDRPVIGIRFFAHDNIGQRADGKVRVRIDETTIGWSMDVQRNGKRHEVDVENVRGTRLVIETASDDEVEISDVEVLYGRRGSGGYGGPREITHEGECIGGSECGGRRSRIRIPLRGNAVESIRFYARDDIGAKAGGELRIRIDDEILRDYLDIPREGRTFTIEGKGIAGDYLIIEPAEDDEVEVKDIRIRFGEERDDD